VRVAHGDDSFKRRLGQLERVQLLVLDDFALTPIAAHERGDLLELLDDRVGSRATIITSQLPPAAWHAWLGEPTLADAILDRVVHGAHKIALKGDSMRRSRAASTAEADAATAEHISHGG
jgi:DNA replication protein DnaC